MADLRARLLAELDQREQTVRAASPAPWSDDDRVTAWIVDADRKPVAKGAWGHADAEHIALHDPADALRRYQAARRVLDRHRPMAGDPRMCRCCTDALEVRYPCDEIRDLADSLGIDTTAGGGETA